MKLVQVSKTLWIDLDAPLDGIKHHPADAENSPKWEIMFSSGRYVRLNDQAFELYQQAMGVKIERDALLGSIVHSDRREPSGGDAQCAPAGI